MIVALAVMLCALWAGAALADGGGGGDQGANAGGTGGTGFTGNDGSTVVGSNAGGGGGGAGGGHGGASVNDSGGSGGAGGTAVSPNGQNGIDGGSGAGGGGGGGGGFNGNGAGSASLTNTGALTGGNGGNGGNVTSNIGGGGGGGAGGYGAIVQGSGASTNSGTIAGGAGGSGGATQGPNNFGGDGGDGGVGVQFTAAGATFTNTGTVTGGKGGAGGTADGGGTAGSAGAGGAGIAVTVGGLTIINSGTIIGGLGGDGTTRANAITFTSGVNRLELRPGFTIVGNVTGSQGPDTLAFGGTGDGTFNLSNIDAGGNTKQYQDFDVFEVDSGTWSFSGATTAAFTVNGGTVMGTGTFGGLTINGGTIAPGNSIGTMTVNGAFTLAAGAVYEAEVNAAGQSDKVIVNGTVNLTGSVLRVLAAGGNYAPSTSYTIIQNDGTDAVVGSFASITSSLAFLTPFVVYNGGDGNDVVLTLARNSTLFSDVAKTRNQRAVAGALGQFPTDNALFLDILNQTASGARQAFDALSGEIHATVAGMLADDSRYVRDAILGRLMQATYTNKAGELASLAAAGPQVASLDNQAMALGYDKSLSAPAPSPLAFWTHAFGAWADFGSDGNAATASRNLGGFVSGMDAKIGGSWRAGVATGASFSNVDVDARYSSAQVDSYHLGGYLGGMAGAFALRGGGMWAWSDIDTSRAVIFPGFYERQKAGYSADTGQLFGEMAYPMQMWGMGVEPFAGLAYVSVNSDNFHERGGSLASLNGRGTDETVGYTTVGLRAAQTMQWGAMLVTPHLSASWQHAFDGVTPDAALAFASTGIGFTVYGVPLAQDSALIDTGIDFALGPRTTAGASYSGQFGDRVTDNAVKGRFTWLF